MNSVKKFLFTVAVFIAAAIAIVYMYQQEASGKWTRDGRVRADVVVISSEVKGKLVNLNVRDNQLVHKGDLLFVIDPSDYEVSVQQYQAKLASAQSKMLQLQRMATRRQQMGAMVVSKEEIDNSALNYSQAKADYDDIAQQLKQAQINLKRTRVYSPVDGYITNLVIQQGDYITPAESMLSLVDKNSFYVYGYFQENQINNIHPGDRAEIKLLDSRVAFKGTVDSISRGITDYSNAGKAGALHDVNPTFEWVRLPMRIPVRIRIDPQTIQQANLVAGMTCTVSIE